MNFDEFVRLPKAEKKRILRNGGDHYLYRCYDTDGVLLYVGCSKNVERRMALHLLAEPRAKASRWLAVCMDRHEVEGPFPNRAAGLEAEREAIRSEQPLFNTQERGRTYSRIRNEVARYLIDHGHEALAIETACTCWGPEDLAELGETFSSWCEAHKHAASEASA